MKKRIYISLPKLNRELIKTGEVQAGLWKFIKEACQEFVTSLYSREDLDYKPCFRVFSSDLKTGHPVALEGQPKT